MRFIFQADYRYYCEHGLFDFPQGDIRTRLMNPGSFFPDALMYERPYDLFIADVVYVATMKKEGITDIAMNHTDFARNPWI